MRVVRIRILTCNPGIGASDIADPLVFLPVVDIGKSKIDRVIKVFVVSMPINFELFVFPELTKR